MGVDRLERVNSLVRREIAEAIPHIMSGTGIDIASVTVTKVDVSSNLRNAVVLISIFGHEKERANIVSLFRSKRNDFQRQINRNIKIKYTPVLRFELDESIERGDHVLDVLSKMESSGEIPAGEDDLPFPEDGE